MKDDIRILTNLYKSEEKKVNNLMNGLRKEAALKDDEGNMVRTTGTYSAETAYTSFMSSILEKYWRLRVNSEEAKNLDFLNDSMPDDDAKEVIKKAIAWAKEEEQKPKKEQWKRAEKPQVPLSEADAKHRDEMIEALKDKLFRNQNLSVYAALRHKSKNNPELEKYLDGNEVRNLQGNIEHDAAKFADLLVNNTPWFGDFKEIVEAVKIRSGVDKGGVRLDPAQKKRIDRAYEFSVRIAHIKVSAYDQKDESELKDELNNYANFAEHFLREAGTLKKIDDSELIEKIKQVHERAAVARRMVEILDTDLFQPEEGNVKERAQAQESEDRLTDIRSRHREKTENRRETALKVDSFLKTGKWPNK